MFWINLPICAVAVVLTAIYVPESKSATMRDIDPIGQLLAVLSLFGLVLAAALKAAAARLSWRLTALACTYGIGYQASALACVAWFPALSSRSVGVCDEGTGAPVGLLYCIGALLVAAELLSGMARQ